MPVFKVWPQTVEPPRRSGQRFAQRNPDTSPYHQITWNGRDGPVLGSGLAASALHELLDTVEKAVLEASPDLRGHMSGRSLSPWLGEQAGDYRWWPTRPTDLPACSPRS
jgi:hypothetical protein